MSKKVTLVLSFLLLVFSMYSQQRMLQNTKLTDVKPHGWLHIMMENQKNNFTGKLDKVGFPFTQGGWGTEPFLRYKYGVNSGFWVPYEQAAYYYDGMLRAGLILKSNDLINKCRESIYSTIKNASEDGVIIPELSHGDMRRWPHAVYFRAMMAEYEASQNKDILVALKKHFKNDTVTYEGRDLLNVETLAWLYRTTGDRYFYDKVMSFKEKLFAKDIAKNFEKDVRQEIHAVTFHEFLKIPIIYYELTGDKKYLQLARNGFEKLEKFHMLPCGISSGEEGLSGKKSINTHEMCNVVDYMWTCSYMLKATKETQWADKIEKVLFNAGIGGITKNFDAHQYYSCPNQIVCSDYSSRISTYTASRLAYRQIHRPPCCTGNLNRMFPVYVGNQWMKDNAELYKMLYGPGEIKHKVGDKEVILKEDSSYPFGDTVKIQVVSGEAKFPLKLRIPSWAHKPSVNVNGEEQNKIKTNSFYTINRNFRKGDVIEIVLPKKGEYCVWDFETMVVNYGPLVFSLPVESNTSYVGIHNPKLQKEAYKGYTMIASSDWNYVLGVDGNDDSCMQILEMPLDSNVNPWTAETSPIRIRVPAFKDSAWQMDYKRVTTNAGEEIFAPMTPDLPARGALIYALNNLKPEVIELVPYGSTLLRITMFPFWTKGKIAAEVLATENK